MGKNLLRRAERCVGGPFLPEKQCSAQGFAAGEGKRLPGDASGEKTCTENRKYLYSVSVRGRRGEFQSKP